MIAVEVYLAAGDKEGAMDKVDDAMGQVAGEIGTEIEATVSS